MDHIKIIKRSWQIMWSYRALWVFGIILAIFTTSGRGSGSPGYQYGGEDISNAMSQPITLHTEDWDSMGEAVSDLSQALSTLFSENIPALFGTTLVALVIGLVCLVLILGVAGTILRYVSTTALIRMVDGYEETEERVKVGKGFRLGWSRTSWRLFLIDLVINIPVAIVFMLLFALALAPLLLWMTKNNVAGILGTVTAVGLFFLMVLLAIIVGTALRILTNFFYRASALQDLGVFESIRVGYRVFRRNLKDSILMWLILLGFRIFYAVGTLIIGFILLIPAGLLGGGGALLAGGFGNIFQHGALPWIMAGLVGIPIFILVFVIPLTFLGGLKETYLSTAWTLTYRDLAAGNGTTPDIIDGELKEALPEGDADEESEVEENDEEEGENKDKDSEEHKG